MKRIIFLNRYFYPDHSATSQLLSDLAFHLAGCGHEISVVTSQQRYDAPRASLPEAETIAGVRVRRIATTQFGRSAMLGRGLDYLTFYVSMKRAVLALANPGDILVAKTDPPLLCILAMHVAKRGSLHLVNWLQDLYPEVAVQLGVPFVQGPAGRGLARLRDASLRAAAANVVVGRSMAENVLAHGVAAEHVHVIANWCDDEQIRPIAREHNRLRREWSLEDRFVVGYSGNLGRAHEFSTVLAAAERLRNQKNILFLFIGGGHKFEELAHCVKERGLDRSFRFVPYQDRALLQFSLSVPDVHWISLNPALEGLIVPSKLYGIAAAGRPIIAIAAKDGEIARIVREHDCGFVIEPGDSQALAETLARISTDPDGLAAMGLRGRKMLDAHFTRRAALEEWRSMLEGIGN